MAFSTYDDDDEASDIDNESTVDLDFIEVDILPNLVEATHYAVNNAKVYNKWNDDADITINPHENNTDIYTTNSIQYNDAYGTDKTFGTKNNVDSNSKNVNNNGLFVGSNFGGKNENMKR